MRTQFEQWARTSGNYHPNWLDRHPVYEEQYKMASVQAHWKLWQAAYLAGRGEK